MGDERGASTYAVTEEQATQPATLPATETSTLPAFPADDTLRGLIDASQNVAGKQSGFERAMSQVNLKGVHWNQYGLEPSQPCIPGR